MKTFLAVCTLILVSLTTLCSQPLVQPFNYVLPTYDTTRSSWLPAMPVEIAGAHGFVKVSEGGHFEFDDGAPAPRFVGVNLTGPACFPDSIGAIVTARHLRKMGVNMVKMTYFDYINYASATTIAPGNKSDTLSASQMRRFHWFTYQLKLNGIYLHLALKTVHGPRRDDNVWGWDSAYNYGRYLLYFHKGLQDLHKRHMTLFFNDVNPFTGKRIADEPQIALITALEFLSLYETWANNRLNQANNIMSFNHSRMIDTMYANYLRNKYGGTNALRTAYFEGSTTTGPNTVKNNGFEAYTDFWTLQVGEGYQASAVIVQGSQVAPNEGQNSLRIAVRAVRNGDAGIYLVQTGIPAKRLGIYKLSFKARTDTATGRVLRVQTNFGLDQTVNLTTTWQQFSFVFRSPVTDSLGSYLRFYCGRQMGDVLLDGIMLQDTGREGLGPTEALENNTVARGLFNQMSGISLQRALDQTAFYDTTARAYYPAVQAHLRQLGVRAPIAGTNNALGIADPWLQSKYDFTSKMFVQWDGNFARPGSPYTDSTWVVRNYSVLNYRDQKIPEFTRVAIAGKPFVAESYNHVFPNIHRSEMMVFYPAYSSLQDFDGAYIYVYNDRGNDVIDRRQIFKDDFQSIMSDPSIMALLPQMSQILRNHLIAPAMRTLNLHYDEADIRAMPLTYSARGTNGVEGSFPAVANMVSKIQIDSFQASRHYTANDYYVTVPTDDNIQSDTKEITLDMTKGVMSVNTPRAQGGSGVLQNVSALRTDNLSVTWIDGGKHVTYWWTSLDTTVLNRAPRSLLTVTTRAANSNAQWTFGDSSFAKNWGGAPVQMENAKIGVNFYTAADSLWIYPLDTMGVPIAGRMIAATKVTNGSWRVTIDLATEKAVWFGVGQFFDPALGTHDAATTGAAPLVGQVSPNPVTDEARLPIAELRAGTRISATVYDAIGTQVLGIPVHSAAGNATALAIDTHTLPSGTYTCVIRIGSSTTARRFVVNR